MERQDPLRNFRYRLEINSITQAGFAEVTVGELSTDPIEYREGDELTTVRKLNGLNKYANITLKWGITESTELADRERPAPVHLHRAFYLQFDTMGRIRTQRSASLGAGQANSDIIPTYAVARGRSLWRQRGGSV